MIIGAQQVSDFQPLKKEEVDALIQQINHAFAQGVPAQETVSFPAFILAQLLSTVKYLDGLKQEPKPMEDLLSQISNESQTEDVPAPTVEENKS
jgi:hypothetical protein